MNLLENCSFPQNPMVRVISYACFCQKSYSSIERLTNLIYKRMMLPESSSIRFTKKVFTISTFFFLSYELAPFILGLHDTSSYTNLLTTLIPLLFTIEKISFPFFYKKTQFEVQIPSFPIQYSGSEDSLIFPIKVDTKPDIFSNLSIEEKVGQLLMVHFNGTMITDDAKILIQNTKVGGIIYYNWSNELSSPQQIQNLSSELQKLTQDNPNPISLLIATDQECGTVSRLNNGFTIFPGNSALGMTENPYFAEKMAIAIGKEMQDVGINMNLAPVVDVSSNRENRIIGIRSFGDKPKKVSRFAKSSLIGYKKVGIIPTLKHFPGHGDVDCDSHVNLPTLNKSMEELEGIELLPFRQLAQTADVIMTAHLLVPALDEKNCSTLSKKSITFLRENIGFNGVIITDSLVMKGVLKECKTVDAAAIQALNAGCDILLLGGKQLIDEETDLKLTVNDIQRIHASIVNAVKNGEVSETRLNEAVKRIIELKKKYLTNPPVLKINKKKHEILAKKIASSALKKEFLHSISLQNITQKKVFILAPKTLERTISQTSLPSIGKTTNTLFFNEQCISEQEIETAKNNAEAADIILICSSDAWKNPLQQNFINKILTREKPAILVATRDPYDAYLFPRASLVYQTYSPAASSIQAVYYDLLSHNSQWTIAR